MAWNFYAFYRQKREPTSGLEPLTPAPATSDQSGVAEVCGGLQIPHIQAGFFSLPCPVLHRIALAVVSEWYQYYPRIGRGLRTSFASTLEPPVQGCPQLPPGARPRSGARVDAQAAVTHLSLLPHGWQVHYSRPTDALPRLSLGVSLTRDKAWPKSSRWLWRRIKEVLPLLVAVGIEAGRTEEKTGSWITLRKLPGNDATDATEDETGMDKLKAGGNRVEDDAPSNATGGNTDIPNARSNPTGKVDSYADSGNGGNSGIRHGDSSGRLTADQVQEVRRLIREGMSAESARKEVYRPRC